MEYNKTAFCNKLKHWCNHGINSLMCANRSVLSVSLQYFPMMKIFFIFLFKNPHWRTTFQHITTEYLNYPCNDYYLVIELHLLDYGSFSMQYLEGSEQRLWGKCPPFHWGDQSSSQSQCAEWSEYNRPAGKTSHPRCCRQSHIGPPPTPHQPRTPGTSIREEIIWLKIIKRNPSVYWACQSQKCSQPVLKYEWKYRYWNITWTLLLSSCCVLVKATIPVQEKAIHTFANINYLFLKHN